MAPQNTAAAGRFRSAGFFMVAFILTLLLLMVGVSLLFGGVGDVSVRYIVSAAAEAALAIPAFIYIRVRRIRLSALFGRASAGQTLAAALAGMLAVPVSLAVGMVWESIIAGTGGSVGRESVPVPTDAWQLAAALLATGMAAPLVEEPVYRGLVLGAQAAAFDRRKAVLVTSVFFALMHGRFDGLPSIFLAGVMLAALAWHSGSIWPSVAAHAAYNAMTMVASMLLKQIASAMPAPQGFSPDAVTAAQYAASATAWVFIALPFAAGLAAVLIAYFNHTDRAERFPPASVEKPLFSAAWPWAVSFFLLLCYLAIDVLQVYGIIDT